MNGSSKIGVGQDPMLDLVNTRDYRVNYGDSPATIAKKFGIPISSLIAANPQKPTAITAGTITFRDIRVGEILNIPSVGLNGAGVGQDPLEGLVSLLDTRDYTVARGDSLARIAYKFGVTPEALIAANPQKPTTVVNGVRTWTDLQFNEGIKLPGRSGVGDAGVGFNFFKAAFVPWGLPQEIAKGAEHRRHVGFPSREGRNSWEHWQRVHPGTPRSDYDNWWRQYGQSGGTISGVGDAASDAASRFSSEPTIGDLLAQGYTQIDQGCFAGQVCYIFTIQTWAGPSTRTYAFASNSLSSRPIGTRTDVPAGQSPPPPASAGVARTAGVGRSPADAVAALTVNDPCDPANVGLVWAAQQAIGVQPDGKWGSGSAKAANAKGFPAPAGCSPRPVWWSPPGQVNPAGSGQFTNPETIYGNAPAPAPAPATIPVSSLPPAPAPGASASPAVQNLTLIDPCDPSNVSAVGAAQSALGLQPDGKYGTGTASRAHGQLGSSAPSACSPRPAWWLPPGQSNLGGAPPPVATPAPTPMPSPAAQQRSDQKKAPAPVSVQAEDRAAQEPASVQPGPGGVVKKHGISTGAIVAGAIGVAGLVGIVALAVSGKGKTTTRYRTRKGKTKTRWRTRKAPTKKSTHKKHAKGKKKAHKKHGKKR